MKASRWSDKRLARKIALGDENAAARFVQSHYEAVFRLLLRLTAHHQMAEDLTQDTFTAAWRSIGNFDGKCRLSSWLYRIAYNKYVDFARSNARQADNRSCEDIYQHSGPDTTLGTAIDNENRRLLQETVYMLEKNHRELVILHYMQGLSYRQISEILSLPTGTIKWKTAQALRQLRQLLGSEFDNE